MFWSITLSLIWEYRWRHCTREVPRKFSLRCFTCLREVGVFSIKVPIMLNSVCFSLSHCLSLILINSQVQYFPNLTCIRIFWRNLLIIQFAVPLRWSYFLEKFPRWFCYIPIFNMYMVSHLCDIAPCFVTLWYPPLYFICSYLLCGTFFF